MTRRWEDLDARARGLATHLLARSEVEALAREPDLAALTEALRRHGFPIEAGEARPAALELAVRRVAAARLRVVTRWCGPRSTALTVVFEDEDRRSLRAIIRGAVQGVAAEVRLSGLVPTPTLPERALEDLATQGRPAAIAARLVVWRNPYGSALLAVASGTEPDLFALELAINRTYAARALAAARGTRLLVWYVRGVIDLENAYSALGLASVGERATPKDAFLEGGVRVTRAVFESAAAAGDVREAGRRLAAGLAGTPYQSVFDRDAADPSALEREVLQARVRELVHAMRTEPLGPAPVLAYVVRLRAEMNDLRRVIWGVTLAVPAGVVVRDLVTA